VIGLHESAWSQFDLGDPPDTDTNLWVYVGKSERSLATRTVKTHLGFTWGCTGRSSFRRTLVALLRERLDLEVVPRNPAKPGDYDRYGISQRDELTLGSWIHEYAIVGDWGWPGPGKSPFATLADAERAVIAAARPAFNLTGVRTPWTDEIKARRAATAAVARDWALSRGLHPGTSPWAPAP
jgi:GIY-YIG catalytic domain-containing protein